MSSARSHESNAALPTVNPQELKRVLDRARWVGASADLATLSRRLLAVSEEYLAPKRAHCLLHDATDGSLWSEVAPELTETVDAGVIGIAVCSGEQQRLERCEGDPRRLPGVDDRFGKGTERMLVQPFGDARGEVHAVLVAIRDGRAGPFSSEEASLMAFLADCVGPSLRNLGLAVEIEEALEQTQDGDDGLFRPEVLAARRRPRRWGDLVRVLPAWLPWAYRVLFALAMGAVAYMIFGRVDVYAAGPAVVRLHDRTEVTAPRSGSLAAVRVRPGDTVEAGEVIARFADDSARGDLERLERAWATQLRRRMSVPSDPTAQAEVARLWQALADARAALSEHEVRAPFAGSVIDLRIRPGQFVNAGDALVSISRDAESRRVVALLPGPERPRLRPGLTMRLEFPGYPRDFQHVVVETVGREVVGPAEAKRYLGPVVSDALALSGPLVVVEGELSPPQAGAEGTALQFHDGMNATAEVRVRSKSIVEFLFPELEGVWTRG